ncbi:hypothetical protein C7S13_1500 [Burkholderia cepacia]|nr:hypothetical protein [Burkholderia cepacia]
MRIPYAARTCAPSRRRRAAAGYASSAPGAAVVRAGHACAFVTGRVATASGSASSATAAAAVPGR